MSDAKVSPGAESDLPSVGGDQSVPVSDDHVDSDGVSRGHPWGGDPLVVSLEGEEIPPGPLADSPSDLIGVDSHQDPAVPEEAAQVPPPPEPVITSGQRILNEAVIELQRRAGVVSTLSRERDRLLARKGRTLQSAKDLEAERDAIRETLIGIRQWSAERTNSLSWKLLSSLKTERQTMDRDYLELCQAIRSPLAVSLEDPATQQNRFMRRCLIVLLSVLGAEALFFLIRNRFPWLSGVQDWRNPFSWHPLTLIGIGVGVFVVFWIIFLVRYYKEVSQRNRRVELADYHVDFLARSLTEIQFERQRVVSVHAQIPEFLELMSEVLHRPWITPTWEGLVERSVGQVKAEEGHRDDVAPLSIPVADASGMPRLMRIAESPATEGGANEARMVNSTLLRFLIRGWRVRALDQLLASIERSLGRQSGSLAPQRLDRDPRLRAAVLHGVKQTPALDDAGTRVLYGLIEDLQTRAVGRHLPLVKDVREDVTDGLLLQDGLIAEPEAGLLEWDGFLAEILAAGGSWSPVVFSSSGLRQIPSIESTVYAPERLRTEVPAGLTFVPCSDERARPVEMAVRVDRTVAPVGPRHFLTFEAHASRAVGPEALYQHHLDSPDAKDVNF